MKDSQDLMNQKLRFTTTAEERKIIRDRLNKFTKPLEKKSVIHTLGGMCYDKNEVTTHKGGSAGSLSFNQFTPSCRASLKSKLIGGQNGKHKQLN
jgi:hypothetical protein